MTPTARERLKGQLADLDIRWATHENIRPAAERRTVKPRHPLVAAFRRLRRWLPGSR